jgi:hypothetical protein
MLLTNMKYYTLNPQGKPVHEPHPLKWVAWFSQTEPRIARDEIQDAVVSTLFLGHAHEEPPILWETMILGGQLDQVCDRCGGNQEQAEAMHARMVSRVKSLQP